MRRERDRRKHENETAEPEALDNWDQVPDHLPAHTACDRARYKRTLAHELDEMEEYSYRSAYSESDEGQLSQLGVFPATSRFFLIQCRLSSRRSAKELLDRLVSHVRLPWQYGQLRH